MAGARHNSGSSGRALPQAGAGRWVAGARVAGGLVAVGLVAGGLVSATPAAAAEGQGSVAQTAQPTAAAGGTSAAAATGDASATAGLDTPAPAGATGAAPGTGADLTRGIDPRDALRRPPQNKNWRVAAEGHYRSLLVTDDDPANDRYMLYRLQGSYFPRSWLSVFARFGMFQRFVASEGESGLRLEDTVLGATAEQPVSLAPWGWERTLLLSHTLRVFLPTSFQSSQQDLYLAGDWSTRAQLRLADALVAGVRGTVHYRFHEYAEQAGPGGVALPRLIVSARPFIEYSVLRSEQWGTLTFGGDVYGDETLHYPSRDPDTIGAAALPPGTLTADDIRGAGSSDSYVTPHYGYDLYAVYVVPNRHLAVVLSLEQNGNVVRYGEPRLYFIHRDQTELALAVSGNF